MKLSKKIIIIAIILAAVTTYGVYIYLNSIQETVSQVNYIEVLVANRNIPAKTKIDKSMVSVEKIAEEYVIKNAVTNMAQITGKYTMERILEGEQILSERLVDPEKINFSYQIPKGKRAVTIKVNDVTGVSDLIKPGDYVDVLVFMEQKEIENNTTTTIYPDITKMFLQDILILSIDKDYGYEEKKTVQAPEEIKERKVTIALAPTDAEKLVLADETGKIHLALRHPEDKAVQETSGAISKDIIPEKGKMVLQK